LLQVLQTGYVAEEVLKSIGAEGFSKKRFFRGIILPPNESVTPEGRLAGETEFPGDVCNNQWCLAEGKNNQRRLLQS
jgi:hypothetical protein